MSKAFSFGSEETKKVLKGLGIALLGALITYMADTIPGIDFGAYTGLVVALNSVLVNAARVWIQDNRY